MRHTGKWIAVTLGTVLLYAGIAHGQTAPGRVVNSTPKSIVKKTQPTPANKGQAVTAQKSKAAAPLRTHEDLGVPTEEKQRAIAAQQTATIEEQKMASRVRSLQALMQKEEQALAQRLAYAAKVRAQGLAKNDQKLLDQAERLERQALDYYQKRVQQFERMSIAPSASSSRVNVQQPVRRTQPSSTYRSSRSTSRSRSRR